MKGESAASYPKATPQNINNICDHDFNICVHGFICVRGFCACKQRQTHSRAYGRVRDTRSATITFKSCEKQELKKT